MLRISGMSVRYGEVLAVADVSLDIARHETVALLGRSGSGKTSLLQAVAGIVPSVSGTVELAGVDITDLPTHRRGVGLVFQDFALFPHLDVAGNVGYGLEIAGAADISASIEESLRMVGLEGLEDRRIDQLSGGQAQRVALARTLATRPGALLLDEPLGSLDPALRASVAAELDALIASIGIPTIIVTHDTAEAFALGDRIAVLDAGRLAAIGEPQTVWSDPGATEVARILGHRGILTVEVAESACTVDGVPIPLPAGLTSGTHTVLVRAGSARFDPAGFPVPVLSSRFRGPHWSTTIGLGTGSLEISTPGRCATGSPVPIVIDPGGVTVLDAASTPGAAVAEPD